MDVIEEIKQIITGNPIVLFMKGTPEFPQCGFSMRTAEALKACNVQFTYVDILAAPDVRANLPKISNWPTFPQVFIKGAYVRSRLGRRSPSSISRRPRSSCSKIVGITARADCLGPYVLNGLRVTTGTSKLR